MKKELMRIICLLLAVVFAFSLSSCKKQGDGFSASLDEADENWDIESDNSDVDVDSGENGSSGNTDSSGGTKAPAVNNADKLAWKDLVAQMPSNLRGTSINVYSWNDVKDVTGAEKVISDFTRQTGIKVNWEKGSYENYDFEIAAKINSGTAPDVIRYNNPLISRMSLTQDVKSATGYDFKGDIWDSALTSTYTVKNKIYGVNLKNTFNQQPTVVMYCKSTISRYKLDDPYDLWKEGKWTWTAFRNLCKEFRKQTSRPAWMTSNQLDYLWFSGVSMIKFDGKKFVNNLSDRKVIDALRACTHNKEDGMVPDTTRESDKLENGTYLFYTDNIIGARRTDYHYSTSKANDDLYCVPIPTGITDKYYQPYNEYEAYGIPKGAKNPQAVYYYLRYYLDANNYDSSMFFCNDQVLETYKWCRSQQNVHPVIDRGLTKVVGNENAGLELYMRKVGTEAQLQNEIDTVAKPTVDRAVNQANKTLEKFS